jgi:hypothetical protein
LGIHKWWFWFCLKLSLWLEPWPLCISLLTAPRKHPSTRHKQLSWDYKRTGTGTNSVMAFSTIDQSPDAKQNRYGKTKTAMVIMLEYRI